MSHCPTCKKLMRGICRYCQPQEYIDMMGKAFTELSDFYAKSQQQRTWVGSGDLEDSNSYLVPSVQRKPLTDEQISDIAINNPPMVHEFARAIEAAHGIKE